MSEMTINEARTDLARLTRKGMGMPMAGLIYWVAVSLLVQLFPLKTALLFSFFATGAVFPLGLLFTRMLGASLINKNHELNGLGGILNAVQAFYWPVMILVYITVPEWTMFTMVVLFCSHFLGYGWLYQSRGYIFLSIAGPVIAILMALTMGAATHQALPPVIAAIYAITCAMLLTETRSEPTGIDGRN